MKLSRFCLLLCIAMVASIGLQVAQVPAQEYEVEGEALKRVSYDVQFLASDELAGRGVGTEGIERAAQYIIDEYKAVGLKPGMPDGSYRQPFDVSLGRQLVPGSFALTFQGPQDIEVKGVEGKNAQPMMVGGSADIEGDLVFVGYGIAADDHNYNEYKDVDVNGKIVVMIRLEPQQDNADSVFNGTEPSEYARVRTKIAVAKEAGAVGIIFVNDAFSADTDEKDEILTTDGFGRTGDVPFVQCKRSLINEVLKTSPIPNPNGGNFDSLDQIEDYIDENLEPVSAEIGEWTVSFKAQFDNVSVSTDNIVGVLEGEGPLADEYVVIGGHYDHLGMGEVGSRTPERREIHNGADDNATGTAAVVELARRFARYDEKPKRTMVFICFSGEERGLLGSAFYVNEEKPIFDLEKTVAMINYDMIGWLRDNKLTIFGTGTGSNFDEVLDASAKEKGIELNKVVSPFAGSDHMPFYQKEIPVMFLHTGLTDTYHTPEDDYESLNMSGAVKVIDFSEHMIWSLVNREDAPEYVSDSGSEGTRTRPSYLGIRFDFANTSAGLEILSVTEDSPAAKAGLKEGDIVTEMAGQKITERSELLTLLRDNEPGSRISVKYKRGTEDGSVEVELDEPRRR